MSLATERGIGGKGELWDVWEDEEGMEKFDDMDWSESLSPNMLSLHPEGSRAGGEVCGGTDRPVPGPMGSGDMEWPLVEPVDKGDSVRLRGAPEAPFEVTEDRRDEMLEGLPGLGAVGFGLSLPVGPLPRGRRLAGGRLRAARRALFSSSSSATLDSRAWRDDQWRFVIDGICNTDLEVSSSSGAERPLDVPSAVWGKVVVAFASAFGRHGSGRGKSRGGGQESREVWEWRREAVGDQDGV